MIIIIFSILIEKLSYSKYLIGLVWEDTRSWNLDAHRQLHKPRTTCCPSSHLINICMSNAVSKVKKLFHPRTIITGIVLLYRFDGVGSKIRTLNATYMYHISIIDRLPTSESSTLQLTQPTQPKAQSTQYRCPQVLDASLLIHFLAFLCTQKHF